MQNRQLQKRGSAPTWLVGIVTLIVLGTRSRVHHTNARIDELQQEVARLQQTPVEGTLASKQVSAEAEPKKVEEAALNTENDLSWLTEGQH